MDSYEQKSFLSGLTGISKISILIFIVVIVFGVFIILKEDDGFMTDEEEVLQEEASQEETAGEETLNESLNDSLKVLDQEAGDSVLISEMSLTDNRWVVIHEDMNGEPGNILGARLFTKENTTGEVQLLRGTGEGKLYHAILYIVAERERNQDRLFDTDRDLPLVKEGGDIRIASFRTF